MLNFTDRISFLRTSDMFSHITQLKYLPRWMVLFFNLALSIVAFYTVYVLSSKFYTNDLYNSHFLTFTQQFFLLEILQIALFWILHTYSCNLKYSNFVDAAKLVAAFFYNVFVFNIENRLVNLYLGHEILFYSAFSLDDE